MAITIVTQGEVVEKTSKEYTRADGNKTVYYNVKIGDRDKCESQVLSVPAEVFNACKEKEVIKLKGSCGGFGSEKWFSFNEIIK